jgi:hypothetical protein
MRDRVRELDVDLEEDDRHGHEEERDLRGASGRARRTLCTAADLDEKGGAPAARQQRPMRPSHAPDAPAEVVVHEAAQGSTEAGTHAEHTVHAVSAASVRERQTAHVAHALPEPALFSVDDFRIEVFKSKKALAREQYPS